MGKVAEGVVGPGERSQLVDGAQNFSGPWTRKQV